MQLKAYLYITFRLERVDLMYSVYRKENHCSMRIEKLEQGTYFQI